MVVHDDYLEELFHDEGTKYKTATHWLIGGLCTAIVAILL
jgi:hypothetical protein